jgi:ferric-dicitrate binding protein FerR (iron transport regulator)
MEQERIWNLIAKKVSGQSTPEELHELELILRGNPELHYPIQTVIDLLQKNQNNPDIEEAHKAFDRHIERVQNLGINFENKKTGYHKLQEKFRFSPIRLSLFFVLTIISLTYLKFFWGTGLKASTANLIQARKIISEISTKNGSKTNLILPDGTKVWLNAGSNLSYDSAYGKTVREVVLSGEAFFDVVKNKEKPFIIHASKINIKVLGTRFDVKSYPSDKTIEASLIRGSIEVTFSGRPDKKVILKPNEKLVVNNNEALQSSMDKPTVQSKNIKDEVDRDVAVKTLTYEHRTGEIIETSWVANKLIFQDESFEEIARQLERWYGVVIKFNNLQMKETHLTGSFQNETIRQALDALRFTASFDYSIDNNNDITIF